jgi:hypothetical protein
MKLHSIILQFLKKDYSLIIMDYVEILHTRMRVISLFHLLTQYLKVTAIQ